MRIKHASLFAAMAMLAACAAPAPNSPDAPEAPPAGSADRAGPGGQAGYHVMAAGPLAIAGVSADSAATNAPASAMIDGSLSTAWSNGGYKNATAWAVFTLGASASLSSVAIKMPPAATGTSYDLQVSNDGTTWTTALANQKNTTWNMETKAFSAGVSGRYVRFFWHNSASAPQAHVNVYEVVVNGTAGTSTSPSTAPTTAPTIAPTTAPTTAPTPTPTPTPSATSIPVGVTPNPGPNAARGRCLVNGVGVAGITIQLFQRGGGTRNLTTDAQGYFTATGLAAGDYYAHYYNATDRMKIGYWNSVTQHVDGTVGAAYPPVDLYQVGMTNTPKMDTRTNVPCTFTWVPQTQKVLSYRFRIHTKPYTSFQIFYQSNKLPGDATTFTWDGSGKLLPLDTSNRYFWGVMWDAGPIGQGGNLYQAIYFNN